MPSGFQPAQTPDPAAPVAYFPYFDRTYLAVAASLNGGNVLATFVQMLVQWMADLGKMWPMQCCLSACSFITAVNMLLKILDSRLRPRQIQHFSSFLRNLSLYLSSHLLSCHPLLSPDLDCGVSDSLPVLPCSAVFVSEPPLHLGFSF